MITNILIVYAIGAVIMLIMLIVAKHVGWHSTPIIAQFALSLLWPIWLCWILEEVVDGQGGVI